MVKNVDRDSMLSLGEKCDGVTIVDCFNIVIGQWHMEIDKIMEGRLLFVGKVKI